MMQTLKQIVVFAPGKFAHFGRQARQPHWHFEPQHHAGFVGNIECGFIGDEKAQLDQVEAE